MSRSFSSTLALTLSMLPPSIGLKQNQFSIPKQKQNPYEESQSSQAEFGRVCSDSLLNPLHKCSSLISCSRNNGPSRDSINESQLLVHQFMDDWPRNMDAPADGTKLSISISMPASDFANEKLALSPLRLGSVMNEQNQRQANWIPILWETSMGGLLGEVLHSTNNIAGDCKKSSF